MVSFHFALTVSSYSSSFSSYLQFSSFYYPSLAGFYLSSSLQLVRARVVPSSLFSSLLFSSLPVPTSVGIEKVGSSLRGWSRLKISKCRDINIAWKNRHERNVTMSPQFVTTTGNRDANESRSFLISATKVSGPSAVQNHTIIQTR